MWAGYVEVLELAEEQRTLMTHWRKGRKMVGTCTMQKKEAS